MTPTAIDSEAREAALRDRIQDVYAAFRAYSLPLYMEHDCIPGARDVRPLRVDVLHRLSPSAFESYLPHAIFTWGNVDDFKHFLPRLLEIVAETKLTCSICEMVNEPVEPWKVLYKFRYAGWRHWEKVEQDALDAYFNAHWAALLARPIDPNAKFYFELSLNYWLEVFALVYDDLERLLAQWERDAGHPSEGLFAAVRLAATIVNAAGSLLKKRSLNWHNLEAQENQVLEWLASDSLSQLMEAAFFRWSQTDYAELLSEGHHWLGAWRKWRVESGV